MTLGFLCLRVSTKQTASVPLDYVCNAFIVMAAFAAADKPEHIPIYNLSLCGDAAPTWYESIRLVEIAQLEYPSMKVVRPHPNVQRERISRIRYEITKLITHWMFAIFIDCIIFCLGYKPV